MQFLLSWIHYVHAQKCQVGCVAGEHQGITHHILNPVHEVHLFFHHSEVASGGYHFHHYHHLHCSPVSSGQNRLSGCTSLAAEPWLVYLGTYGEGERELADDSQGRCLFGEFPMPTQGSFLEASATMIPTPPLFSIQVEHS